MQGLQGLQGFFFTAAQGLHGLHGLFAAHGLHGLQTFAAHGLQAPQVLAAQGLHPAATWIDGPAALDTAVGRATAPVAKVATLSATTVFLSIYTSKQIRRTRRPDLAPLPAGSPMTPAEGTQLLPFDNGSTAGQSRFTFPEIRFNFP